MTGDRCEIVSMGSRNTGVMIVVQKVAVSSVLARASMIRSHCPRAVALAAQRSVV